MNIQEPIIKVVWEMLQNYFKITNQQNAQCSSLDIYVITLYRYVSQSMRYIQGTGFKCQIFYKKVHVLLCHFYTIHKILIMFKKIAN